MSRSRSQELNSSSNTMDQQHHTVSGETGMGGRRGRGRRRGAQAGARPYLLTRKFVEELEHRLLMTTVITDTDPLTPAPSSFTFEYKDHSGGAVRVNVVGDVTAEFIFARMTKGDDKGLFGWNEVILGEHVPAGSKEDGRDLFLSLIHI